MKTKNLLKDIGFVKIINENMNLNIRGLSHSTSKLEKGCLFFCLKGVSVDGHSFAHEAVSKGAVCLVVQHEIADLDVMQVIVSDTRIAMCEISKRYYDFACDKMNIIAVVGTNGKSSVSLMLQSLLEEDGQKTAVIGTDGTSVGGLKIKSNLTTPDPIELHYLFKQLLNLNVKNVVLEVSVQSIYFNKIYGISFFAGILTNISPEHLDFFESYEKYIETKLSFFRDYDIKNIILNADCDESFVVYDEVMRKNESVKWKISQLSIEPKRKKPCKYVLKHYKVYNLITYGIYNPCDTFAMDIKTSINGSRFIANCDDEIYELKTKLVGVYNVYNLLSVLNVAKLLGVESDKLPEYVENIEELPGRFNVFDLHDNNKVIVDYAHTAKAYEEIVSLTRKLRSGKIVSVFGCVGYSDKTKRQEIGRNVAKYSDEIIITTDNLLDADFAEVFDDILEGIKSVRNAVVVTDTNTYDKYYAGDFRNATDADAEDVIGVKNVSFESGAGLYDSNCAAEFECATGADAEDVVIDVVAADPVKNKRGLAAQSDCFSVTEDIIVFKQFDRNQAVFDGVTRLYKNDTLLLLGKGVESVNKIGDQKTPQNDAESLMSALNVLAGVKVSDSLEKP